MSLPKVKAVLYKSKVYKDGTHPILIRVTQDRRVAYKSTGFSVLPEAWDEETGFVYDKKPQVTKRQEGQLKTDKLLKIKAKYANALVLTNAKQINSVIVDTISEVNNISNRLKINEKSLDVGNIKRHLTSTKQRDLQTSFIQFAKSRQDKLLKAGSYGTHQRYKVVISRLQEYRKQKDVRFSDLTLEFLEDYEIYLNSLGYKINTVHNHFKTMRAVYYSAIKEGVVTGEGNPFFVFKLKLDNKVKKAKLSIADIKLLEELELEVGSLTWHCRNCFLFSFYCAGIRISDLLQLKWENVTQGGRLEYKMKKTNHPKSIALLPKANEILKNYKSGKQVKADYIFPFMDAQMDLSDPRVLHNQISAKTALINKYLRKIGRLAGIEGPLSTHIARHSFSDIARKRGANVFDISKMLGHSSVKITEAYLASLDLESQDITHKNILDF